MSDGPSPNDIGYKFVAEYYKFLHADPGQLHRFYSAAESTLSHGTEGDIVEPAIGQREINELILAKSGSQQLQANLTQVDCQTGPDGSILIQVVGSLGSDGNMKKFCQSFCLTREGTGNQKIRYSIHNDIFRYLKDVVIEDAQEVEDAPAADAAINGAAIDHVPDASDDTPLTQDEVGGADDSVQLPREIADSSARFEGMLSNLNKSAAVQPSVRDQAKEQADNLSITSAPVSNGDDQDAKAGGDSKAEKKPFSYASAIGTARPAPQAANAVRARPQQAAKASVVAAANSTTAAANEEKSEAQADNSSGRGRGNTSAAAKATPLALYVKGIPQDCTEADLEAVFKEYGEIKTPKGITIHPNKNPPKNPNQPLGRYAFVEFVERDACAQCLKDVAANPPKEFKVLGRRIYVTERVNNHNRREGGRGRGFGRGRGGRGGGGRGRRAEQS